MMKYLNEYRRLSLFAFGIPPVYLRPIFLAVHPYFIFSKPLRKDILYIDYQEIEVGQLLLLSYFDLAIPIRILVHFERPKAPVVLRTTYTKKPKKDSPPTEVPRFPKSLNSGRGNERE